MIGQMSGDKREIGHWTGCPSGFPTLGFFVIHLVIHLSFGEIFGVFDWTGLDRKGKERKGVYRNKYIII